MERLIGHQTVEIGFLKEVLVLQEHLKVEQEARRLAKPSKSMLRKSGFGCLRC